MAVNQCSGNSRGFFEPRVAGGQLANGAMGNAKWRGVPLKAVLDKAGVMAGAKQVTFNGLDGPAVPETPDFVKALDIDHARDGEVMLAYAMNGADLPHLNGYPMRLVVPGYYGTYWVKHLNEITVIDEDLRWFLDEIGVPHSKQCLRVHAAGTSANVDRADQPFRRALVHHQFAGRRGGEGRRRHAVKGIAFDGGYGHNRCSPVQRRRQDLDRSSAR